MTDVSLEDKLVRRDFNLIRFNSKYRPIRFIYYVNLQTLELQNINHYEKTTNHTDSYTINSI